MNFIQTHRIIDLLKDIELGTVYLQFENEKEFIIQDILKRVKDVYGGKLILEFTDLQSKEYYDQFDLPYLLSFDGHRGDLKGSCGDHFCGFTFDYDYFEGIHMRGYFDAWVTEYYRTISFLQRQIQHHLIRRWDSDIFPSLNELLDFDYVSLPICSEVEVCFRNVDLKLFEKQVDYIRKHNL